MDSLARHALVWATLPHRGTRRRRVGVRYARDRVGRGTRRGTGWAQGTTGWVRRAFGERALDEMVQGPPGWSVMAGA